jgi:hypothetical protein
MADSTVSGRHNLIKREKYTLKRANAHAVTGRAESSGKVCAQAVITIMQDFVSGKLILVMGAVSRQLPPKYEVWFTHPDEAREYHVRYVLRRKTAQIYCDRLNHLFGSQEPYKVRRRIESGKRHS